MNYLAYIKKGKNTTKQICVLIIFLFMISTLYGQNKIDYSLPNPPGFGTYEGDTSFIGDGKRIWRIKKGKKLYEYYLSGNLQSVTSLKKKESVQYIDVNKVNRKVDIYDFHGQCSVYYDKPSPVLAVIGHYENNEREGEWKYFDPKGRLTQRSYPLSFWTRSDYFDSTSRLVKQIDRVRSMGKTTTVREIVYENGKEIKIIDKTLFAKIFLRYTLPFILIMFLAFFSRVFINSRIYNRENGTDFSPIYFHIGPWVGKNFEHSIICTFSFWFSNYKSENRTLVLISNTLSVISLGMFFGAIIGLTISGELQ